jgi:predicted small lipoprotein YifL
MNSVRSSHMSRFRPNAIIALAAALALAAVLGGCGVKGALEAPPEAKASGTATSPEAADPGKDSVVQAKPHKPFILDGLLR